MERGVEGQIRERDRAVALVLGAMVLEGGLASPALRRRAVHAVRLWQAGEIDAMVLSGAERWHAPSEAAVMAVICRAGGVPEQALMLEEAARDPAENLALSRVLLAQRGEAGRGIVVTDTFHGPRVRMIARRLGMQVEVSSPPEPHMTLRGATRQYGREGGAILREWWRSLRAARHI